MAAEQPAERPGRNFISSYFVRGQGIEIGALHNPLHVVPNVQVRYVDRMPEAGLRLQFPEVNAYPLVPLFSVEDGEKLAGFNGNSQDFVIANHFIEHAEDPIGTLKNIMRVLRPGGILYMAVPDKRLTFDRDRPITPFQHIVDDHNNGPAATRMGHFEEWTRLVAKLSGAAYDQELKRLLDTNHSIHFHVWDKSAIALMLLALQDPLGYELELCMQNLFEVLTILRKRPSFGQIAI